ncbi:TPA: hypothetical protein SIA32_003354 [Aeromonas sobria]|jgi:hypothetical protein|nr:hypothetical protein [Aeromonas sobria]
MKNKKIVIGSLLLCTSFPLISQAATLDMRGGYRTGSHVYETRLKVSEGWQNGVAASLESNTWNTTHDNNKETFALNDVQAEVNYKIMLDDQWSVRPGMLTLFNSHGTRYGPYVKLSWDVMKDLNLGIRYRYDWKAYKQEDLSGEMSRDNAHRWDGYLTYKINNDFTFAWQTTIYSKQNNYLYGNNKKSATENAFVLQYQMMTNIMPYIEYDYLDRQGTYNGNGNIPENSYRIGVSIKI